MPFISRAGTRSFGPCCSARLDRGINKRGNLFNSGEWHIHGIIMFFSWMRSKGSRISLWGSGGCGRSTLRNRSQPFATVRNRSGEAHMAVPMASSAAVAPCQLQEPGSPEPIAVNPFLMQTQKQNCEKIMYGCRRRKGSLLQVSSVALLRFAWQAWHFVTFRRVS